MASVARFGYQNAVLAGQLSAGSQALSVGNLQTQLGASSVAWQTTTGVITSAGGAWVRGYLPTTQPRFDAFGIFRTNLTNSATWRARVFSDAYVTAVYDSGTVSAGVLPGIHQAIILTGVTTAIGSYWQIDIDDPGNPDGFLNVPLMYVGPLLQPIVGLNASTVQSNLVTNVVSTTRYGQSYVNPFWTARQFVASLGGIFDIETAAFRAMDDVARDGTNLLVIPDVTTPNILRDAVFGTCTSQGLGYSLAHKDTRTWAGTFLERI